MKLQKIEVRLGEEAAFAKAWATLGYNSLGETGVVRCDLFAARTSGFRRAPNQQAQGCSTPHLKQTVMLRAAKARRYGQSTGGCDLGGAGGVRCDLFAARR